MQKVVAGLDIEVRYKKIKNVYLRVGKDKTISVNAPLNYPDSRLVAFVSSRAEWIKNALERVEKKAPPEIVDGGKINLFGVEYTVKRQNPTRRGDKGVKVTGREITVTATEKSFVKKTEEFFSEVLKSRAIKYLEYYSQKSGMAYGAVEVKKMRSKWGYCVIAEKKIVFSLNLAYKPLRCLEYVALHELAHTRVAAHDKRFYAIVEKYMPDYKSARKLLK